MWLRFHTWSLAVWYLQLAKSGGALETVRKGMLRLREGWGLGALRGRAVHPHWLQKCHL